MSARDEKLRSSALEVLGQLIVSEATSPRNVRVLGEYIGHLEAIVDVFPHASFEEECSPHPDAPHGFDRSASHSEGRYVCECQSWSPPHSTGRGSTTKGE